MNIICTICRSSVDESSISSTICGHIYHYQCILQWTETSKTCPECRQELNHSDTSIFKLNLHVDETATDSNRMKITELEGKLGDQQSIIASLNMQCDELKEIKVELEARVLELSNTASDLRDELEIKSIQLQEMEEHANVAEIATQEFRDNNLKLETRVQELLNSAIESQGIEEDCANAVEIATQENENLRERNIELETRVRDLINTATHLREELTNKSVHLRDMEENCAIALETATETNENLMERNIELEARVKELSNTATHLRDELTLKSIQLRETEEDCANAVHAVATAIQKNEKLRTKNAESEKQVQFLLEKEIGLNNELDMKNQTLEECEENCAAANIINSDLRNENTKLKNRVKQHLKMISDLENRLEENHTESQDEEENVSEENSFSGESSADVDSFSGESNAEADSFSGELSAEEEEDSCEADFLFSGGLSDEEEEDSFVC